MKSKRIYWIWALSLIATFAIIALQGYWLYNQYIYNMQKTADEMRGQVLSGWEDYKSLQSDRLRNKKERLKSYATNFNQSSVFISKSREELTIWDIRLVSRLGENNQVSTVSGHYTGDNIVKFRENFNLALSQVDDDNVSTYIDGIPNDSLLTEEVIDSLIHIPLVSTIEKVGDTKSQSFKFITKEPKSSIEEAADLYLSFENIPLKKTEIDSIIYSKIPIAPTSSDTITLTADSILWQPAYSHDLKLRSANISIGIPYSPLEKKVINYVIPIRPSHILQTMFWQIVITLLFLLLLIFALDVQIKAIRRQMRINELRQNFVNTTIHELKRPIQTLKSIVSFLQGAPTAEANDEVLSEARKETDNLTAYLQRLREVNDGENISDSLHLSHFDFAKLSSERIELARKNAHKEIQLTSTVPSPLMVTGDKGALGNVLTNLLENAIKYSGETVDIKLSAQIENKFFTFSISDNGFGIPAEEQSKIMQPFYRSHSGRVAELPGMGLGLSYVKMIIDAHRGSIAISSEVDKGTIITIKMPQL